MAEREGLKQILAGEIIDRRGAEIMAEISQMVIEAYLSLGFSRAWINRSRGQRARRARQRQLKGVT